MAEDPRNPARTSVLDRFTPAWGIPLWLLVFFVVWLVSLFRGPGIEVTVEITADNPITVEGFVRSDGKPVSTGNVDVRVVDALTDRALFVKSVEVEEGGQFKAVAPVAMPPATLQQTTPTAEQVLKVFARYAQSGGGTEQRAEQSQLLGTSTETAVRGLILLTIATFGGVLYLTVAPPTAQRIRVLFALSHLAVVSSFLLPLGIGFFAAQDSVLVEQMKRAPVGLVEASVDGEHTDWLVRIGGELRLPAPTIDTAPTPQGEEQEAPAPAEATTPPVDGEAAEAAAIAAELPTLEGGVAVPLWALVLAAFGAAVAMAREVPSLQRMCPISGLPRARFPSTMSQFVGGLTLGLFGADPLPPPPATLKRVATVRRRLMHLYLNIVAAPFLAIAVYYLVQALGGDPPRPTFVVIAFATGFVSDLFIARIKKFVVDRTKADEPGLDSSDDTAVTSPNGAAKLPPAPAGAEG